jgi:hypothetical protein
MKKEYTPIITIFKNFLPDDEKKIVDKYCRENKDNFEFVGYGGPIRWKEYTHSKDPNLKFKRSFLMTEEEYILFNSGQIEEPYPNDTRHGDNYKISMAIPTYGQVYDVLDNIQKKTEEIILDVWGDVVYRETEPWLAHAGAGSSMKLHCDGTILVEKNAGTDFSSVYYINDDYEGGNFNMPVTGFNFKPLANSLLIWSDVGNEDAAHEVLPILSGDRFVSQGFFSKSKELMNRWPKERKLINEVNKIDSQY